MGQKRQIVREFVGQGLSVEQSLSIVQMPRSTYYYRRNYKSGGRKRSENTFYKGILVSDEKVIQCIKDLLAMPFIDYGYRKVTVNLKREGYQIGKKKVFRLMKENNLLNPKRIKKTQFDKEIIKSKPKASKPMEIIEIDIKYVYINAENRNAFLITLLDTFHREAYCWTLNYSMKAKLVVDLILEFVDKHLLPNEIEVEKLAISFRTDNGSQFTSKAYRKLMERFNFRAMYIPPATPQLNGHIESFHSTVQKLVCNQYEFTDLQNATECLSDFFKTYNSKRYLTCLLNLPPKTFIDLWNQGKIVQKEHKNKLKFFFKEEDKATCEELIKHIELCNSNSLAFVSSPPFEVNLINKTGFFCVSNCKDSVNSLCQIGTS